MKYDLEYDGEAIERELVKRESEVSYADVYYMMERVSEGLGRYLPLTEWEGLRVVYDKEAHSKKRKRHVLVSLKRARHRWWVVDVFEGKRQPTPVTMIGLSDKKEQVVRHAEKILEKDEFLEG